MCFNYKSGTTPCCQSTPKWFIKLINSTCCFMAIKNEPCTSANNADSVPSICAISEGCSASLGKQCFKQEYPRMCWNIKHVYLSLPNTVTLARPSQNHAGWPYTKVYAVCKTYHMIYTFKMTSPSLQRCWQMQHKDMWHRPNNLRNHCSS